MHWGGPYTFHKDISLQPRINEKKIVLDSELKNSINTQIDLVKEFHKNF